MWLASNLLAKWAAKIAHLVFGSGSVASPCIWDCGWYARIIEVGYDTRPWYGASGDTADWPFFPLFPLFARWIKILTRISTPEAAIWASKISLLLAIWSFITLAKGEFKTRSDYFIAGAMVALNPYVVYAHAGYAEPLYFALCAFAFHFLSRDEWVKSGSVAALLSATRIVGSLFVIPYILSLAKYVKSRHVYTNKRLSMVLGLLLCPLGMTLFALYLYHLMGDALAFEHGVFAWGRALGNPLVTFWISLRMHGWPRIWATMSFFGLLAGVSLIGMRRQALGVYLVFMVLMPISSGMVTGIPRYIWWQPPLLLFIFIAINRLRILRVAYVSLSGGLAGIMILLWYLGRPFLI